MRASRRRCSGTRPDPGVFECGFLLETPDLAHDPIGVHGQELFSIPTEHIDAVAGPCVETTAKLSGGGLVGHPSPSGSHIALNEIRQRQRVWFGHGCLASRSGALGVAAGPAP